MNTFLTILAILFIVYLCMSAMISNIDNRKIRDEFDKQLEALGKIVDRVSKDHDNFD